MSEQNKIPDAAVEAATTALLKAWGYEAKTDSGTSADIRIALEAAAPHMQELQWGVRDRHSLMIAGHPSEESALAAATEHPEWYKVVSRPMPGLWSAQ